MIYLGCFQIYLAAFKFEYNGTEKGVLPYLCRCRYHECHFSIAGKIVKARS